MLVGFTESHQCAYATGQQKDENGKMLVYDKLLGLLFASFFVIFS